MRCCHALHGSPYNNLSGFGCPWPMPWSQEEGKAYGPTHHHWCSCLRMMGWTMRWMQFFWFVVLRWIGTALKMTCADWLQIQKQMPLQNWVEIIFGSKLVNRRDIDFRRDIDRGYIGICENHTGQKDIDFWQDNDFSFQVKLTLFQSSILFYRV